MDLSLRKKAMADEVPQKDGARVLEELPVVGVVAGVDTPPAVSNGNVNFIYTYMYASISSNAYMFVNIFMCNFVFCILYLFDDVSYSRVWVLFLLCFIGFFLIVKMFYFYYC